MSARILSFQVQVGGDAVLEVKNLRLRLNGNLVINDLNLQTKIYAFNITAPTKLMNKRAELVKKLGGNCVMIDILTCGFAALQDICLKNRGLIIHAHRAMHGALTRGDYGI